MKKPKENEKMVKAAALKKDSQVSNTKGKSHKTLPKTTSKKVKFLSTDRIGLSAKAHPGATPSPHDTIDLRVPIGRRKHSVVIVDDHTLFADGLKKTINSFKNFKVLYDVQNGNQLRVQFEDERIPEVVLLDINMPGMNGYQTVTWLRQSFPQVLIIILTEETTNFAIVKMLKSGIHGYLSKTVHPKILEKAMETVMTGIMYLPEWLPHSVAPFIKRNDVAVSNEEITLLKLMATELTYPAIASRLNKTTGTVESQRDKLFKKVMTNSRIGLVIYALREGWINLNDIEEI